MKKTQQNITKMYWSYMGAVNKFKISTAQYTGSKTHNCTCILNFTDNISCYSTDCKHCFQPISRPVLNYTISVL